MKIIKTEDGRIDTQATLSKKYKFVEFDSKDSNWSAWKVFKYWYYHWKGLNLLALFLKCWKFKYLFHDIEKPFLYLIWKDYGKVHIWHQTHNAHHLEYQGNYDIEQMFLDWECSGLTKLQGKRTCREFTWYLVNCGKLKETSAIVLGLLTYVEKYNLK